MSTTEAITYAGLVLSLYATGFACGYVLHLYRRFLEQI